MGYTAGSNGQEWYLSNATGERLLKRSVSSSTTTLTVYAFGLQELSYSGSGTFTSQIDYYALAGHLIGSTNGTTTTYYLTDAQGSVLTSLSASAIVGQQVYGPYGNTRYQVGSLGTTKGYTGQFHDAVSGLDYYHARYYDPVIGQFLSVDSVQGNVQGDGPYSYVDGNPETENDPTGQWGLSLPSIWSGIQQFASDVSSQIGDVIGGASDLFGGAGEIVGDLIPWVGPLLLIGMVAHSIWNQFADPTVLGCGCVNPPSQSTASVAPIAHQTVGSAGIATNVGTATSAIGAIRPASRGVPARASAPAGSGSSPGLSDSTSSIDSMSLDSAAGSVASAVVENATSSASSTVALNLSGTQHAISTVNSAVATIMAYNWVYKETADGKRIKVRKLTDREVHKLKTPWGNSFEDEKQQIGAQSTDDIYVDDNDPPDYYIGRRGSDIVDVFP